MREDLLKETLEKGRVEKRRVEKGGLKERCLKEGWLKERWLALRGLTGGRILEINCSAVLTEAAMGFFAWHRQQVTTWQNRLHLDSYQLLWVAFFKGLILGGLIGAWWL